MGGAIGAAVGAAGGVSMACWRNQSMTLLSTAGGGGLALVSLGAGAGDFFLKKLNIMRGVGAARGTGLGTRQNGI